jgi:hypothetical protein
MALLASDGASRPGCDWFGDYGMRRDGNRDLAMYGVGRVLRSFATPVTSPEELIKNQEVRDAQTEDLLDVLTLAHPPSVPYGCTTQDELRGHAGRILSSPKLNTSSSIPRKDIMSLITLLLSIQLDERSFGSSSEGVDGRTSERLAHAMVRRIAPNEDSDIDLNLYKGTLSRYLVRSFNYVTEKNPTNNSTRSICHLK